MLWAVNSMLQCQKSLALSRHRWNKSAFYAHQQNSKTNTKIVNQSIKIAPNGRNNRNKRNKERTIRTTFKYNMCQVMDWISIVACHTDFLCLNWRRLVRIKYLDIWMRKFFDICRPSVCLHTDRPILMGMNKTTTTTSATRNRSNPLQCAYIAFRWASKNGIMPSVSYSHDILHVKSVRLERQKTISVFWTLVQLTTGSSFTVANISSQTTTHTQKRRKQSTADDADSFISWILCQNKRAQ